MGKFHAKIRLIDYGPCTLQELSETYCRLRDASLEGASTFAPVLVYETNDRTWPIGYIAYNGRIFEGQPQTWTASTKLLYDNW